MSFSGKKKKTRDLAILIVWLRFASLALAGATKVVI
jgi:hypothetical protein